MVLKVRELQRNFLEILERKDDHIGEIQRFQDNYNNFLEENQEIIQEKSTKEYIFHHLDTLYENLWNSIEIRKNSAITERTNIVECGWIEEEMDKLIANVQLLMQIEMNKLLESLLIIQNFYSFFENRPMGDFIEHLIIDPFEEGEEIRMESDSDGDCFPKMKKVYEKTMELIEDSVSHLQKSKKYYIIYSFI